jgi:GTP cyclohydrolase II
LNDALNPPPMLVLPPARVKHSARIPLSSGVEAVATVFEGLADGRNDHIALSFAGTGKGAPLVRVHSECLTGDVFGSARCDCGPQLVEAMERCGREGGHVLYLRQEGRGIGLAAKIAAYVLQDQGLDTFAANRALGFADDERDYRIAAQMLQALGVDTIRLLSNNPVKAEQLEQCGITVAARESTRVNWSPHNRKYLLSKRKYAGHALPMW